MKQNRKQNIKSLFATALLLVITMPELLAQTNISQAIDGAGQQVAGIFDSVSNLILVVGAVVGLAGGIRVYVKWQNQDQDVQKALVGWLGSAIFLVLVGVVLKTFFGL